MTEGLAERPLKGKTFLLTGASRGIVCRLFPSRGLERVIRMGRSRIA